MTAQTTCTHLGEANDVTPSGNGCVECEAAGGRWVHLRLCMTCGHVGCCDSSPSKHATAHNHVEGHPLITSYEPGEDWWWCYADEVAFSVPGRPTYSHT